MAVDRFDIRKAFERLSLNLQRARSKKQVPDRSIGDLTIACRSCGDHHQWGDAVAYSGRDLIQKRKQVLQIALERFVPELRVRSRVCQLRGHPQTASARHHTALEDEAHARLAPYGRQRQGPVLVGECRRGRNHEHVAETREIGGDTRRQGVRDVRLRLDARMVGERQHQYREGHCGQRRRTSDQWLRRNYRDHAMGSDTLGHVFEGLLPQRFESGAQRSSNRQTEGFRCDNGTWLRDRLQASGDVHSVTVDRPIRLFHHVTQVQTNPEPKSAICAGLRRLRIQVRLYGESRGSRAHRCVEDREHGVARGVDDAPSVQGYTTPEYFARRIESADRGVIVLSHQPRIVHCIGR